MSNPFRISVPSAVALRLLELVAVLWQKLVKNNKKNIVNSNDRETIDITRRRRRRNRCHQNHMIGLIIFLLVEPNGQKREHQKSNDEIYKPSNGFYD